MCNIPATAADRYSFVLLLPCLPMLLQAPDCKHGLGSKIKIGLCAMDKKVWHSSSSGSSSSSSTATRKLLAGRQHQKQCTAGDINHVPAVLLLEDVAAVVQLSKVVTAGTVQGKAGGSKSSTSMCLQRLLVVVALVRARQLAQGRCACALQMLSAVAQHQQAGSVLSCLFPLQAQSKPMCEILARLTTGGEFEVITFGDKVSSDSSSKALRKLWYMLCA
jgi:hypothetical protein